MGAQWRVQCYECGNETNEYLRMHTQLSKREVKDRRANDRLTRDDLDEHAGSTVVECNACGHVRTVKS